jgi:hypothetical protein
MSLDASRWAWKQPINPSAKLLLLALADRAGPDNTVWPSYEQLIVDTGLDRKTISKKIGELIALGLVADTHERTGKTKQIPIYKLVGVEQREFETVPKTERYQKRNSTTFSGNSTTFSGNSPKNGTRNLPLEPTKEPTTVSHDKIVFDGSKFINLNGYVLKWQESYPAINVMTEVRKAEAWLMSNPKNKKSNYARFLNNWLSKAQDNAGRVNASSSKSEPMYKDWL